MVRKSRGSRRVEEGVVSGVLLMESDGFHLAFCAEVKT